MSKKLLLADDSITIQKVIQITFAHEDYDLTITDNGDAALDKAREIKPDLILADVYMPGRDGYALTSAVKQDPDLRNTTVLLLTGSFEPFDEEKAKLCQADAWIEKPFESQALIDKVEELLTAAAASQPEEPVSEVDLHDDSEALEKETLGDFDEALEETDDEFADFSFEEEPISPEVALHDDSEAPEKETLGDFDEALEETDDEFADFSFEEEPISPEVALSDTSEDSSWSVAEVDEPPLETEEIEELTFEGEPSPIHEMESTQVDEFDKKGVSDESEEKGLEDEEDNVFAAEPLGWQDNEVEDTESHPEIADVTFDDEEDEVLALQDEDILETEDLEPALHEQTLTPWSRDQSPYEETWSELEEEAGVSPSEVLEYPAEKEEPLPDQTPDEEILQEHSVAMTAGEPNVKSEPGISSMSEKDMEEIVEKVAQKVVEGLAGSILEKIAWEVVPDLAESLIREEIRKIKEAAV